MHLNLDVSVTADAKWAALHAHHTQFGPDNVFRLLPRPLAKRLISREHFALAWPEASPGLRLSGLFDGL